MQILHRNIWKLFFIIFLTATILLAIQAYLIYQGTFKDYQVKLENLTTITTESTQHIFEQYETILALSSKALLKDQTYTSAKRSSEVLKEFMAISPQIIAFGLIKPNGEMYASHKRDQGLSHINLLKNEKTKQSFQRTLTHDQLIVGRTYYQSELKKLIIPLRKRIVNENNEVVAVISAGIDIQNSLKFLDSKVDHHIRISLYRELDQFMQYLKLPEGKLSRYYDFPIDKKIIENTQRISEKLYGLSLEQMKEKQTLITYSSQDQFNAFRSSLYLKKYGLWVTSEVKQTVIFAIIYYQISLLFSAYIAVMVMIFVLFRIIDKNEKKKQDMLFYQSTHDYLTNLYNRFYYSRYFKKQLSSDEFAMFIINVDNFKLINDTYAYDTGDMILKEISRRLKRISREKDILIRYSGDEFILIRYGLKVEHTQNFSDAILNKLNGDYLIHQVLHEITVSIGIIQFPEHSSKFTLLKSYGDIALREAKKTKSKAVVFNKALYEQYKLRLDIENELKNGIVNDEFYLNYQPQFDSNHQLVGVEALLRWQNKKLGFIPPDQFIPICEASGFIHSLGEYVMQTALREIKMIQDRTKSKFRLSINISAIQLREENFYARMMQIIKKSGFDYQYLTLEITESVLAEELEKMISILKNLKQHKIQISLDDFGTGYSSLSLLKEIPLDELKIDKSFVQDMSGENSSNEMISTIITLGKHKKLKLVAEGVEETSQLQTLKALECDIFQGYLFEKPLGIKALEKLL